MYVKLKVQPRTSRTFDIPLTEEELASLRVAYWTDDAQKDLPKHDADVKARAIVATQVLSTKLTINEEKVLVFAITSISIWIGGTYWYRGRAPQASKHTRMRAFEKDKTVYCPRCEFILKENGIFHVEPHARSKTLNNPHFICPECNVHVIVSGKRSDYEQKQLEKINGKGDGLYGGEGVLLHEGTGSGGDGRVHHTLVSTELRQEGDKHGGNSK